MITIESSLAQDNVPVASENVANYMLVKLFPTAGEGTSSLPLNLSVVIDNSGSMYGTDQRITHAVEAACHVVDMLGPQDVISVVAFHDHARILHSSISAENKEVIREAVRSVTGWESGGTRMATGMVKACEEVARNLSSDRVNRVMLLTDGNTEAESECQRVAEEETRRGIVFSTFGVGDDYNERLLVKIAELGRGRPYYVDTPAAIPGIFERELAGLQKTLVTNVVLTTVLKQGVTVKKARLVEPEIADVVTEEVRERELLVKLGSMQKDEPVYLLFQLSLGPRQPGQYNISDLFAMFDAPGEPDQRARTDPVSVLVTYTTDPSQLWQNGDVLRYVDMEHVDTMVKRGTILAEQGQKDKATKLLSAAAQVSQRTGDKVKTKLIEDALGELGTAGRIDRKTQLAMTYRARETKVGPEEEVED